MMYLKICSKCGLSLKISMFAKDLRVSSGLKPSCKKCNSKLYSQYKRKEHGLISCIYKGQKSSSKTRGHNNPSYTKDELTEWLYENGYYALWCQWVNSNFNKGMLPSCDRLNDMNGYSLQNIALTTWDKNRKKAYKNRREGITTCGERCINVSQFDLNGNHIKTFKSMVVASRKTGINNSSISSCARGKQKTAGGFIWKIA